VAKTKLKSNETPLMKQYFSIKEKYSDALLLFRVGDFYETFCEDAEIAAKVLGIVLTQRKNGAATSIALAGFPHHSVDTYLPKLVKAGYRVAICDQLEDPKQTKTIVKRGVTELVSPGVAFNDKVLDHKSNNFLACIHAYKHQFAIAFLDISTGDFSIAEGSETYIKRLLANFNPSEILSAKEVKGIDAFINATTAYHFELDTWVFKQDYADETLLEHFKTTSFKGFGVEDFPLARQCAAGIMHYLQQAQHSKLGHINTIARIDPDQYMWLDDFTVRNLELIQALQNKGTSLLSVIDDTLTPMGGRLLKRWLVMPLKNKDAINHRLSIVEEFVENKKLKELLSRQLSEIGDVERLVSKVAVGKVNPKELNLLLQGLNNIVAVKDICTEQSANKALHHFIDKIHPCTVLRDLINTTLKKDAAIAVGKGPVISSGINADLDELRVLQQSGKQYLLDLQNREAERTGIPSLKIAFNNVFGYYLEVRNTHKDKVPEEWIRKQTLVNAERYITEELKEYEGKILGAEDKILSIESRLFNELILQIGEYIEQVQSNARCTASIDVLNSFATSAIGKRYVKPIVTDGFELIIKEGRHPVIEHQLKAGDVYISNNTNLDTEEQQVMMITGPNMSGKSAYLRQNALIAILAQIGSYVPAEEAQIGCLDKIFTRVGASDNISSGESTFMVEMNETASILNNLSSRSLILLDEIGRGTSTYDGVSIAWAVAEYIHEHPLNRAKTLFATHYHELNQMEELFPRIKNFNVSVKESAKNVLFLRKIVAGGSEHSFGIHVAKMAGMPSSILSKAEKILKKLEKEHRQSGNTQDNLAEAVKDEMQLSFFKLDDPILEEIREEIKSLDINTLTPVEALMKLNEIKKMVGAR